MGWGSHKLPHIGLMCWPHAKTTLSGPGVATVPQICFYNSLGSNLCPAITFTKIQPLVSSLSFPTITQTLVYKAITSLLHL